MMGEEVLVGDNRRGDVRWLLSLSDSELVSNSKFASFLLVLIEVLNIRFSVQL